MNPSTLLRLARAGQLLIVLALLASTGLIAGADQRGVAPAAESRPRVYLPLIMGHGPQEQSDQALIAAALEAGRIDYGTSLLYRAYALFADPRLPAEFLGSGSVGEDQALFVEAADPSLPVDVQAKLRPFLVRPDHPDSVHNTRPGQAATLAASAPSALPCGANNWASLTSPTPGVKIRVHAKCSGDYEADIREAHRLMGELWTPMTDHMGMPLLDMGTSDAGGNDDIDLYLLEPLGTIWREGKTRKIGEGAMAVAPSAAPYPDVRSSGFILLARKDIRARGFKSTLAHEFFHVLQSAHNDRISFQKGSEWWFVEASATWASANFVPETSLEQVHTRFSGEFQSIDDPLHLSVPVVHPKHTNEYASYIWPFFMEQEMGEDAIARAWRAIELAGTDWDKGMAAIDVQLSFEENFHRFALRNLNSTFGADNPLGTRYVDLDEQFPNGYRPDTKVVEHLLPSEVTHVYEDSIPSLEAHYYHFSIDDSVRQVLFDFGNLVSGLNRKISAVVKIKGKPWAVREYLPDLVRFCRDNPEEDLEEIWLIVSNHNTNIASKVTGSLEVRALKEPCGCNPALMPKVRAVQQWQGAVTLDYSAAATDARWRIQQQRLADVSVTLEPQIEAPLSFIGSPGGAVSINDQKYQRTPTGDKLFLGQVGAGQPVPYIQAENKFSRVTLNFRERDCTYNWRATFYVRATISADGEPDKTMEVDIGSVQSDWMPFTSTLALAGLADFPAHSPEYIFQHGPPFYEQADYELASILGEDKLGAATVTWRFTPVNPLQARRRDSVERLE